MRYLILLHGLGSNNILMLPLKKYLTRQFDNFSIINVQFDSIFNTINEISRDIINNLNIDNATQIIFIGHSLGGIIATELSHYFIDKCDVHCITLGTPYNGAYLADFFRGIIPILDCISPMLKNLSRRGNYELPETSVPHHVIIGNKRITKLNPITWITSLILVKFKHHDSVVEILPEDYQKLKNKQIYTTQCDHVNMIFDMNIYMLLSNIIRNIVDLSIKKRIY